MVERTDPCAPFAGLDAAKGDIAYARDDGMPFPGWAPPLLSDAQASAGYQAGERFAVIVGDPADPAAGLLIDRRNGRLVIRTVEPPQQLVYTGEELALAEALWDDAAGSQHWARRASPVQLRVARRPAGAQVWVDELLAYAPAGPDETLPWPAFGEWAELARNGPAPWVGDGALDLIDADGWILDALESAGIPAQWRELGRRYDAPRAFGLPPETQAKLAQPLGWRPVGRRWRMAADIQPDGTVTSGAVVVTHAVFSAGAGANGDVVTTVTVGEVEVAVGLPSATVRVETRSGKIAGSPPRPSTGAQVAVTAILEAGAAAHKAVVDAVMAGRVPTRWLSVLG